jgi:hypothetical protein
MTELSATLFVLSLFVVRFALPLVVVLLLGWLANRVQAHWDVM